MLKAYGAEVVVCPTAVDPEDPRSYYSVSDRLAREIPGAWKPDQYANPNNPLSHYETTGPEIWEQTGGKVDAFVASTDIPKGTSGSAAAAGGLIVRTRVLAGSVPASGLASSSPRVRQRLLVKLNSVLLR